jgi:hypothetical protein
MTIEYSKLFVALLMLTSCAKYYLTTDSLRNQFSQVDSTNLKTVTVRGPAGEKYNYLANPIDEIECIDKNGNAFRLPNSPSIEMRVTEANGKRTIFYFDRIFVTDSTLSGSQSRFISSTNKTIKLKNIEKIEIQDGKKNFDYVKR